MRSAPARPGTAMASATMGLAARSITSAEQISEKSFPA